MLWERINPDIDNASNKKFKSNLPDNLKIEPSTSGAKVNKSVSPILPLTYKSTKRQGTNKYIIAAKNEMCFGNFASNAQYIRRVDRIVDPIKTAFILSTKPNPKTLGISARQYGRG